MPLSGDRSNTDEASQCNFLRFVPCNGERSCNLPLPPGLQLHHRAYKNPNARTGEMSFTLSVRKPTSVTWPSSILGVSLVFQPATFPSNPGLSSCNFLETAFNCSSAVSLATSFSHFLNAG